MEKFNFNQAPVESKEEESLFDPRLEDLWEEYGFPGKPPRKGTEAERRLHEKCGMYTSINIKSATVGMRTENTMNERYSSDSNQRQLHNDIAVMVMGRKRSGMEESTARAIANFACEYALGMTLDQFYKYKSKSI
jgi:hypothetical protein